MRQNKLGEVYISPTLPLIFLPLYYSIVLLVICRKNILYPLQRINIHSTFSTFLKCTDYILISLQCFIKHIFVISIPNTTHYHYSLLINVKYQSIIFFSAWNFKNGALSLQSVKYNTYLYLHIACDTLRC